MSITSNPATSQRIAQTIDNLRITEEEFKLKVEECNQLRAKLQEAVMDNERLQVLLRKQENMTASRQDEHLKAQHALDIVLKELHSKNVAMEALQTENVRLKRDLEGTQRHAGEVMKTLQSKSASRDVSGLKDTPSALYLQQCFRAGCDAHTDIVRGLHSGTSIEATSKPVSFQQLNALVDVLELKRTLDPLQAAGPNLEHLELVLDSEESYVVVAALIRANTSIRSVVLHGVGSMVAADVASALSVADHIASVSLPGLTANDTGFQSLMKVVINREQLYLVERDHFERQVDDARAAKNQALVDHLLAAGPARTLLSISELDLSKSQLREQKSFELIRGLSIRSLNLAGSDFLSDNLVGEILRNCPQLQNLNVSHCPLLTNDTVSFINAARSVTKVSLVGCAAISKLTFFFVEELDSDLTGVSHLECPKLRLLPRPLVHFRLVSLQCPALEEVTFRGLSFSGRELLMISESSKDLKRLSFIRCRLGGADYFFRMMRQLTHLSLHGCKGVTDADVMCFCSRLESLDLTENYCLTDKCMKYLADSCANLAHFTLKRCANITDQGIACFVQHASLEFLNVLGMKKVTIVALHRLITSLPSIRRIVHESLVSASVQVDREDVEEAEHASIQTEQSALLAKRDVAALSYVAGVSASPKREGRPETADSSAVKTPRPPTSDCAAPKSLTSPHGRIAQAGPAEEAAPATTEDATADGAPTVSDCDDVPPSGLDEQWGKRLAGNYSPVPTPL